jgi:hypothetical protein
MIASIFFMRNYISASPHARVVDPLGHANADIVPN